MKSTMKSLNVPAVLRLHRMWIRCKPDGVRAVLTEADLAGADLRKANLTEANLRRADLTEANLTGANLREAVLTEADLTGADLTEADLRRANLTGAKLIGANLDFSAWPLWCGSRGVVTDDRLKIQLLAHVAALAGDITDPALAELLGSGGLFRQVVQKCHRAEELGLLGEAPE